MSRPSVPLERVSPSVAARWLEPRAKDAHKGDAGRVYVLAGSRGMAGAAVLASLGAVRSGAGLVRIGTVSGQRDTVARRAPLEVTVDGFAEDSAGRLAGSAWRAVSRALDEFQADVVAVGPGLGRSAGVAGIIRRLLYGQRRPVVLDADGLNALAALATRRPFRAPVVLTPHPGEMARLLGRRVTDRAAAAVSAARRWRCVALLKGAGTLVSDGERIWRNATGNPAMAGGGMGDVLTGIVAATWAQAGGDVRRSAASSAALAACVHGLAGDQAVKRFPERTLTASDVAEHLPAAFRILWRHRRARRSARRPR